MMKYQKEEMFFAYITGRSSENRIGKPVIHFTCAKHRSFGLKVEDVYCSQPFTSYGHWFKMESKKLQNNAELLQRFTFKLDENIRYSHDGTHQYNFDIKTVCTIGNYYYEMMDDKWLKDLWLAATDQKLTDVEIFVGTVKLMEAHQVVLSARSPVLNILLNKVSSDATKSIVTFGAEFDVDTVKHFLRFLYTGSLEEFDIGVVTLFLQFLYTGSLEPSASKDTDYKQLFELAKMYEVETLKNFCQVVNVPPDVEDVTSSLLELLM
jgi:speckle-type POZ protein